MELVPLERPPDPVDRVMGMLDTFLGTGRSMAEAKDLFELLNAVRAEKAKRAFTVAMNACQAEMPTIIKDKRNRETDRNYAPLETIKTWSKPHFIRHGFALSFTSETGSVPGTTTVHLDTTHVEGHTQRTTIPDCELDDKGPKGGAVKTQIQGRMSTLAYAQGRLIVLAFNLTVADEDRDGQAESIGPEHIEKINELIEQCEAAGKPVNLVKFLFWLQVESLDELPLRKFPLAVDELQRKLEGKK